MVWLRARGDLGDDVALNQAMLAYASDYSLLGTSMRLHGKSGSRGCKRRALTTFSGFTARRISPGTFMCRTAPSASGARGFNRGALYREDGVLVASAAQKGLIRARS